MQGAWSAGNMEHMNIPTNKAALRFTSGHMLLKNMTEFMT